MEIFRLTQRNFASIGVNLNQPLQQHPFNAKIFIGFLMLSSYFICNLVFVIYNAKTFTEYTQSIYMGSLAILMISILAIIIFNEQTLVQIINDCGDFVHSKLKYSASTQIFNETIRFERKLNGIVFFIMVKVTPACCFAPFFIYNYFTYFTTDLGNEAFKLPFPIWLPFDWKNPVGFLMAVTVECIMLSFAVKIGACILTFAIGIYLYAIAMNKCIKQNLFAISQNCRSNTETENGTQRNLIREQLIEYIEFDSSAKRFVETVSDFLNQFSAIVFLWSFTTICGALVMIHLQMVRNNDNVAIMLITTIQVLYAFGIVFICCELPQQLNLAFEECSNMIDQFEWYLLPIEIQRMLPIAIHFAQQPVNINCFGSVAYDRTSFKYAIKTAFQYFMVVRKFYD